MIRNMQSISIGPHVGFGESYEVIRGDQCLLLFINIGTKTSIPVFFSLTTIRRATASLD